MVVTDTKMGSHLSIVKINMFQTKGKHDGTNNEAEKMVTACYATVGDMGSEGQGFGDGPNHGDPPHFATAVDDGVEARFATLVSPAGTDGHWTWMQSPLYKYMSVLRNVEF